MKVILQGSFETDFSSVNKLMSVNKTLSNAAVLEECIIDMQRVDWFNAALCSFFKAFLRQRMAENRIVIRFLFNSTSPSNMKVRGIFERNGFFSGQVRDFYNTIFPVRDFRTIDVEIESFLKNMKEDFLDMDKFPFSEESTKGILRGLGEIFSNSQRHSESDWVYTSGQLFPNRNLGQVVFCITDVGVGIVKKVKTYMNNMLTSEDAINWAFEEGNTTKNGSGGLGLFSLKNIVEKNNGDLIVVSNDIYYDVLKKKMHKLVFDFTGTLVIVIMNRKG